MNALLVDAFDGCDDLLPPGGGASEIPTPDPDPYGRMSLVDLQNEYFRHDAKIAELAAQDPLPYGELQDERQELAAILCAITKVVRALPMLRQETTAPSRKERSEAASFLAQLQLDGAL